MPGVHGQAIHLDDPGQRVLRGYIGTLELWREVTDPQKVADLLSFATHGALGHAERRTELVRGHAWLARGVGQEVDVAQRIHHPSRPRGTAAGPQRRGPLARQLRHRPPGEIRVLLVEDRQAHRVGDADNLLNHRPQFLGNLQLIKRDHGNPSPPWSPRAFVATAFRAGFLAAADRSHFSAGVTTRGCSRPNRLR